MAKKKGKRYWDNKLVGTGGVVNEYVKYRDAVGLTETGRPIADCFTCGKRVTGQNLHAGHFITRGSYSTRYDEENIHAQCGRPCNKDKTGNVVVYEENLRDFRGDSVVEELKKKALEEAKGGRKIWEAYELENLYNDYKVMLNDAKKNVG